MSYDDLLGQGDQVASLQDAFTSGRFAHAYLIAGPLGTGKRTLAQICARALQCISPDKPCGVCAPCLRALSGNHPDILRLQPKKSIGVDDVRELVLKLQVKPYEGNCYAVVIEQADKMTVQAQNALLKTLESPPGVAVFFLLAENPAALLPTIRSRCLLVRLTPIGAELVAQALLRAGIAPERAGELSRISQGSVGRALALDQDAAYAKAASAVSAAIRALTGRQAVAAAYGQLSALREQSDLVFDLLEARFRAHMLGASDGASDVFSQKSASEGARALRALQTARRWQGSNVSFQNAMERMFFTIVEGDEWRP